MPGCHCPGEGPCLLWAPASQCGVYERKLTLAMSQPSSVAGALALGRPRSGGPPWERPAPRRACTRSLKSVNLAPGRRDAPLCTVVSTAGGTHLRAVSAAVFQAGPAQPCSGPHGLLQGGLGWHTRGLLQGGLGVHAGCCRVAWGGVHVGRCRVAWGGVHADCSLPGSGPGPFFCVKPLVTVVPCPRTVWWCSGGRRRECPSWPSRGLHHRPPAMHPACWFLWVFAGIPSEDS